MCEAQVTQALKGLGRKVTRILSGVAPVAAMTKPFPCPHGKCVYCPGGPDQGTPQSYVGEEPALMRAVQVGYHPYRQVNVRLRQYEKVLGFFPSKVELIVMGGTFPSVPLEYQEWFVAQALEAMNRYPDTTPPSEVRLEEAQAANEFARVRCIGITIETRPDWAFEPHADLMLRLGATKVEVGVQTIYDDILRIVRRGHTVEDVVKATRVLKDSGFKVVYHLMPGLPGSDASKDLEVVREIFSNPDFRPDYLKIYPTLVIKGTVLYEWWRKGEYEALTDEEAVELISEMYRYIPKYVRVQRVQRDVPATIIEAGPRKSNLRELVEARALQKGIRIREIRWREVGRRALKHGVVPDLRHVRITRMDYEASEGHEVFLAVEDEVNDVLIGILRLRIPSERAHRPEVRGESVGIVRELHVYGPLVPVGREASKPFEWQHRGWGRKLLEEAERIARHEFGVKKMLILSGIGVRNYYRRLGYSRPLNSPYMVKELRRS
ncbi:MAG: tRNA uridine(34) 5-carboxymethylaminomethyl modification radical SAM/GNAT enzyme Elp3 [Desulfurococcales archaeon]|nr:tRNA uridine(34) 5-carboxymethylaminomethyl modification radical SAM/GNAT enzyme Elp3 [Desulfurococcales archaeon]